MTEVNMEKFEEAGELAIDLLASAGHTPDDLDIEHVEKAQAHLTEAFYMCEALASVVYQTLAEAKKYRELANPTVRGTDYLGRHRAAV